MERIIAYRGALESYMEDYLERKKGLIYDPLRYILSLGGKRLRPCLVLATAEALGGTSQSAMGAAAAIEFFHNFTLLHDDIMDDAPTRRGQETVHLKWNRDQAILSGDIMYTLSMELMHLDIQERSHAMMSSFIRTAEEVCVGQQMDMDFELRDAVTSAEYLKMIELKTSVLIGAAMEIGALSTNASDELVSTAYALGLNMGLAFQIQDDILDAFGSAEQVGKQEGGDILQNKKTLLYIHAMDNSDDESRRRLKALYAEKGGGMDKVNEVRTIMSASGALGALEQIQRSYLDKARKALFELGLDEGWNQAFEEVLEYQIKRVH